MSYFNPPPAMASSSGPYDLDADQINQLRWSQQDVLNPMLILEFHQQFLELGDFETTKRTLEGAMNSSGGSNMYSFQSVKYMQDARTRVFSRLPSVFWSPDHEIADKYNIQKKPTISTTVLASLSEEDGAVTTLHYDFFKITSSTIPPDEDSWLREGPGLDAEGIGNQLNLDPQTVEWLKIENPRANKYRILVLNYELAFFNRGNFESDKQAVATALTELGATRISDRVFKFDDRKKMQDAKGRMMRNMTWCFYHPLLQTAQYFNISQQPTITTSVISCDRDEEDKWWIIPERFFMCL